MGNDLYSQMSDDELIGKYLSTQKRQYFGALYGRYSKKVFSKCLFLLKNEELAADTMQDIFIKITLNLSKFKGNSKFSTWVYSVTYNYCIDVIRKQKKQRKLFLNKIEEVPEPIDEGDDEQKLLQIKVSQLKIVLDEIPIDDKIILLMKYQSGMSIEEISKSLNKTNSAVKMRLKRAKQKAIHKHKIIFNE